MKRVLENRNISIVVEKIIYQKVILLKLKKRGDSKKQISHKLKVECV